MSALNQYVRARNEVELEALALQYEELEATAKLGDCELRELVEGIFGKTHFAMGAVTSGLAIYREKAKRAEAEVRAMCDHNAYV
jgi:hypothetical protein